RQASEDHRHRRRGERTALLHDDAGQRRRQRDAARRARRCAADPADHARRARQSLPRRPVNAASRGVLIVGWWLVLAALAALVSTHIKISGDLRSFMPPAQTDDQKLLMDEIGNGPASQLLLVAIGGPRAVGLPFYDNRAKVQQEVAR